jgi:hemoglobin-like flavoprotein
MGAVGSMQKSIKLLPSYMIVDAVVNEADLLKARECWEKVVHEITSHKFFEQFYIFSDKLDASSLSLYKDNVELQIHNLIEMINTSTLCSPHNANEKLNDIANDFASKGVKTFQYAVVGDVFMRTLKHCLGDNYDKATALAWTKILSVMLTFVMPASLFEELVPLDSTIMKSGSIKHTHVRYININGCIYLRL